jgi:hypothetical protein
MYSAIYYSTHLVFCQLCLHQSSANGFQRQTIPFLWVSELYQCLSYNNSRLTRTKRLLFQENSLQTESLYVPQEGCPFTNQSQSQSHITTDGVSHYVKVSSPSGTCDQILLSVRRLFSEICCLVSMGRPIWREVGSVICLSLSSNLPLFTSNIYVTCVLQFSNLYTMNIKLQ